MARHGTSLNACAQLQLGRSNSERLCLKHSFGQDVGPWRVREFVERPLATPETVKGSPEMANYQGSNGTPTSWTPTKAAFRVSGTSRFTMFRNDTSWSQHARRITHTLPFSARFCIAQLASTKLKLQVLMDARKAVTLSFSALILLPWRQAGSKQG